MPLLGPSCRCGERPTSCCSRAHRSRTSRHSSSEFPERWTEAEPLLEFEYSLRTNVEGFAATTERDARVIVCPARAVLAGEWWTNDPFANGIPRNHYRRASSVRARMASGIRGRLRRRSVSRHRPPLAGPHRQSVRRGTYRDLGISVRKTKRFSRWVLGWISLDLGVREWLGDQGLRSASPPA